MPFVRSDHIGRPVFATNASGVKTWTAAYLPFGGVRVTTGTPPTARFPGQWFQSETGLHQNWMRDYDPTTGRYMQADPLGLVAGASVYGYALQNPGRYTDPTGECPLCIGLAADIALSIAIGYYFDEDGCYTWGELGRDAAFGAVVGPAFRGLGIGYNAWRASGVGASRLAPSVSQWVGIGATGKFGEGLLKTLTGGIPQTFRTSLGLRFVDAFMGGAAHEAKTGLTSLTRFVQRQIAKDAELLATQAVQAVTWYFYTSPVTGLGGWSQALHTALVNAGITVVRH